MSIEQKINYQLNKFPAVKKGIKRMYQLGMYAISKKIKSEGKIIRISPDDGKEYFFGYYDKSPWDITDRYMLCMRANNTWSDVSPKEKADILLIDTEKSDANPDRVKKIAETSSWNVQQGCMLQWLGPDYSSKILFNDYRDGKYVSVILTLETMEEKVISAPVYSVSSDGKFALTLDFSRLYELRPGYGYYNVPEKTKGIALPDSTAIWKVDLENGEITSLLSYSDFANFQPRKEMKESGAVHKVNHIMISPNGNRFMVLYRWFNGQRKYTRLITCNVDGTDMYVLSDDDMVSHCFWKNDDEIIAFENKKETGSGYYLMRDKTQDYEQFWSGIDFDGHPSYSPDGSQIVFDRYPDRARTAAVMVSSAANKDKCNVKTVARVFAPFKYDNDTRCDLHPRWSRDGKKICFDSVFEGHRGLYTVDVSEFIAPHIDKHSEKETSQNPKYSIITPMFNSFELMRRYFETLNNQTYKNFEVIIVDDCSTDGSYEEVCSYAEKSQLTISVYKSEKNLGPGNARNIGMNVANGEWITFVDNDDWVEDNLLEMIDEIVSGNSVNSVIYDYYTTDGMKKNECHSLYCGDEGIVSVSECIRLVRNHTFGKFYKLDKCKEHDICFPKLKRCEDVAFVCRAIDACGSVYYFNEPMYYYYQRPTSLSNNRNLDETDMIKAFEILEDTLGNEYPTELREKSVCDLLYGVLLMMCKAGKNNKTIKNYICEYENKYPEWWKCEIVDNLGKAKKLFLLAARFKKISIMRLLAYVHSKLIG